MWLIGRPGLLDAILEEYVPLFNHISLLLWILISSSCPCDLSLFMGTTWPTVFLSWVFLSGPEKVRNEIYFLSNTRNWCWSPRTCSNSYSLPLRQMNSLTHKLSLIVLLKVMANDSCLYVASQSILNSHTLSFFTPFHTWTTYTTALQQRTECHCLNEWVPK